MRNFKISLCMAFVLTAVAFVAAFAAQGIGTSNAVVRDADNEPISTGLDECEVECLESGDDFVITSQDATFENDVQLSLEPGKEGIIHITRNDLGQFDIEIILPSDITAFGEVYHRENELVFDGVVDSWPVGTNNYVLRERVNFYNDAGEELHIDGGVVLTLEVN